MKRVVLFVLTVAMLCAAGAAGADYFSGAAVTVDGIVITPEELESAMLCHQIQSALSMAERGLMYNMTESINIIDALSKVLFELEIRPVIRAQAALLGADELTETEKARAAEEAGMRWELYRDIVMSENGMAFLPAGDYEPAPDDPEETVTRYLNSFGLTERGLYQEVCDRMIEHKLKEIVTEALDGADEDARIDYYTDWILERFGEAEIREDGTGIAEVCLKLAGGVDGAG